jgi:membrane-associated phospholipid phosphatase
MQMRKRIANLTSNILNPFLVSLIIILLLSFESTSSSLDALKWALILIALSILPVFSVIIYLVRNGRLDGIFTSVREQRTKIYWLAGACASVGCIVLFCCGAPTILVATFVGGLSGVVIFMCINLVWKISLHTAFITASVTVLVILYGWIAAITVVLIPLMSWARIELKHHSPAQVATGALLAALIVVVMFYLFGLV